MRDLNEFLAMGGYAFYVWSSYLITLVVLLLNMIFPRKREKQLIRKLSKRKGRNVPR